MARAKRGKGGRFVKRARKARKHHVRRRKHVAKAAAAPRRRRRRSGGGKRRPAVGYIVGTKRIRRRKLNPRHRRRARRHNPRWTPNFRNIPNLLMHGAWGAAGALVSDVGLGYLLPMLPLPAALTTGYGKHAVKIGNALVVGYLAKRVIGSRGEAMGAGAMVVAMYGLLKDVIVQFAPTLPGLGDYEEIVIDSTASDLGAYLPGTGAYLPSGSISRPGPVGAYISGSGEEGMMMNGIGDY